MHPSTGLEIRRLGWHRPSAGTKRVASQTLQMLWLTSQRSRGTARTAASNPDTTLNPSSPSFPGQTLTAY
jgi:hypothetical protein